MNSTKMRPDQIISVREACCKVLTYCVPDDLSKFTILLKAFARRKYVGWCASDCLNQSQIRFLVSLCVGSRYSSGHLHFTSIRRSCLVHVTGPALFSASPVFSLCTVKPLATLFLIVTLPPLALLDIGGSFVNGRI